MTPIKQQLYACCQQFLARRIDTAQQAIHEAQASADEETKSSAGDKYETGRAMMQIEMEKHNTQLNEAFKLKQILDQVNVGKQYGTVQPGSVIITDKGNFFMAISAGRCDVEGKTYMAISHTSPIGMKLIGLKASDSFSFNNQQYKLLEVW